MDKKKVIKEISVFQKNTITDYLGIKITDYGDNYICGEMPVDDRTKQPYGLLHGGASVVFAETLGSIGAGMNIEYKKKSVVGIEINASHLQSIKEGLVYGRAEPFRIGRTMQVWNINITDKKNNLICTSRLTLAVINKK